MSTQLALRTVSKAYSHGRVLAAVSATVGDGERVAVVGENGAGKSTLLRLIAGPETPDEGEIVVTADGGIGYLGQVLDLPDTATVGDALDAALADLRDLQRRIAEAEQRLGDADAATLTAYGEMLTAFELRGGYQADARARAAMSVLGIGELTADRELGTLSGGQRARLALAGVLAAEPELLLLDEPTNHLDEAALTWLENRLRRHRGTLVVVTHDRLLLQRVATAILEVDGDRATVVRYGNGYAGYLAEKRAARQRWEQAYAEWTAEIDHWTEWGATTAYRVAPGRAIKDHNKCKYNGDGRRVQASISTRVRGAAERLDRLHAEPVPRPPDPLRLHAPLTAAVREGAVLTARGPRVTGRLLVPELSVAAGERVLVTGPNGAGKSTLLDVLAGVLMPDEGTVDRRGVVGYLPQESPIGDPSRSLLSAFAAGRAGTREEHAERLRSLGLFRDGDFGKPVGMLSVGQRRRLALARLLAGEADVLLLDEPTNHLSLVLVEQLEQALADYPGAVVVVSHDRMFRERWTGAVAELAAGKLGGTPPDRASRVTTPTSTTATFSGSRPP
ncbi:ABC-F family ATP-binding cassette domain-containing protein [Actinoplanes oblitus]|uniref:ABC-F family ATP-binding cassette domain-containing protein n=1 Tax=Actinoplanes oblitus TaxID=3040509 RepID=A0ABY8WBJ6_9ACTN|nr:ABC-F family ATP-binding cassette domain-containing protein [Actinoplanes oblitus]WIM94501.1 ABC-F family ATP-binding cassette domain-containing protein [Actinoplanes oblitus]